MLMRECLIDEIQPFMKEYLRGLSSPFDSFLEKRILASAFYVVHDDLQTVGYYAIHRGQLLTQFYLRRSSQRYAQDIFTQVLERHLVTSLFVPTCDELFLSLAIDKDFSLKKQAYFFQDSRTDIPGNGLPDGEVFRLAHQGDLQHIQHVCGNFLDHYEQKIADGEIFTYYRGSVLLGIGVVKKSRLFAELASIGMFANEAYRKQGIGRTILFQLKKWCQVNGITPISGCWYYNEASKRTLESAGMITKTRLLNIEVTHE